MGYLGSWKVDDLLTFPANTHAAATGAATDADSVPSYRVYEDETGTAILTGSMAKLDDANTTGFYSEQITLSAANGFEKGKCYTVYISAAVSSVTGTMSHTFQMEAEVDANVVSDKTGYGLAANAVNTTSVQDGAITEAKIADGAIDAATFAANAINNAAVDADVTIASVTGAVGSVTGAVGSVTGNVGGNVVGSVASVTAGVTVTTNNDKTGYGLSAAAVQAIWDALTSALTTVGSIGKRIADNLDAAITSRMATFTYTTPPTVIAIRTEMDSNSTKLANLDATVSSRATPAQVNTEVDTALADYDAPTFAELDARTDAIDVALVVIDDFLDTEILAIKAKTDLIPAAPAATGDIPSANTIADAVLSRGVSNVQDTADTTSLAALILATFESSAAGTVWTIRKTGGTTFVVKTLTLDAAADPVTGVT